LEREWTKLHNEYLYNLFSSLNIVQVTKSRRRRWVGQVSRRGGGGEAIHTGFWWGIVWERDHLGDPSVNGCVIIRWIFRKWDVGVWTGSSWLRIGTGGGQ
jgi:hypothetical protein